MNILEELAGLAPDELADHTAGKKRIPGRVAHIDADFMAYITQQTPLRNSAESARCATLVSSEAKCMTSLSTLQAKLRAESYVLHITPAGSTKGGRPFSSCTAGV